MSNLNLIQLPVDATVLFDQLEAEFQHRMAFLQSQYEASDPKTEEGQAVMIEIEVLAREATEAHNGLIEIRNQMNDLQLKNNILVKTIQVIKESKEAEAAKLEDYRVRLERIKEGKRKAAHNSQTSAAYEHTMKTAQANVRR